MDDKAGRKMFGLVKGSGLKSDLQLLVRGVAEGLALLDIFRIMEQNDTEFGEVAEGQSCCSEEL